MQTGSPIVFRERTTIDPHEAEGSPRKVERERLLQARIKDLTLHLAGTPLERFIQQLYAELEAKGLSFRPECYLSDQWGCPSGVPVIGIPFYLADPELGRIERELGGELESERDILMYLRHEAGHAFNYAYRLYDTDEWRRLFGDYGKPYLDTYKPKPFSRRHVVHIAGWYAQKHPDEDFAETFAVWLTPGLDWKKRYAGWGALKKLEYVEQAGLRLGRAPPVVTLAERDLDVGQMEDTVLDYYRQRQLEEKVELSLGARLDEELATLFEPKAATATGADTLLRAERQLLAQAASHFSGLPKPTVLALVDHLTQRAQALDFSVHPDKTREYLTKLTALVTALAMNYVHHDRFVLED